MSEDLLSSWIAEEEALLARQRAGAQPERGGVGTREQFEGLTGLEALRRMIVC